MFYIEKICNINKKMQSNMNFLIFYKYIKLFKYFLFDITVKLDSKYSTKNIWKVLVILVTEVRM